ncbi:MAG TPA: hypothetical protein VG963_09275, partial [Polyangiaceae bacterium]|nr:hypothetical protein [Polyangiaceae bacterium]
MSLIEDLRGSTGELRETHISWVILYERRVFKLKKPVNYGFLDFTSLDRRLAACRAEVRLNARLAPGVYLGVAPVFRSAEGRHRWGECLEGEPERSAGERASPADNEEVVDYAVVMRRLPDAERADLLLAAGALDLAQLDQLAALLAEFHAAAATGPTIDELGSPEAIASNVRENFCTGHEVLACIASDDAQAEVE